MGGHAWRKPPAAAVRNPAAPCPALPSLVLPQVCGAYLIVIDAVLLPTPHIPSLPNLTTELGHPVNSTQWGNITQAAMAGLAPAPAPGGRPDSGGGGSYGGPGGSGVAVSGAPAPGPEPVSPRGGGATAELPFAVQEQPAGGAPPSPPGAPPNCTALAASGQLITVNGTLAGCGGSAEGVMSIGETQTVVSDAGQVNRSALAPPQPPPSGARAGWRGTQPPLRVLALALLAAVALLAC